MNHIIPCDEQPQPSFSIDRTLNNNTDTVTGSHLLCVYVCPCVSVCNVCLLLWLLVMRSCPTQHLSSCQLWQIHTKMNAGGGVCVWGG